MANPEYLEVMGNQINVVMDDGTSALAYPTMGGMYVIGNISDGGGGSGNFVMPFPLDLVLPGNGYMTEERPTHEGIDFTGGAASHGNPIPCSADGIVAVHDPDHSGWGNYVRVEHNVPGYGTVSTLYAHMVVGSVVVSVGNPISQGDTIGLVNNTGSSFGSHLHFETWNGTVYGTHMDPVDAIPMWNEAF